MSNLRSLLPAYGDGTSPDLTNRTSPLSRLKTGSELVFVGLCSGAGAQDTNYCRNTHCCWVVPTGVTRLTFEAWGAGGGGAGACCCEWGWSGGSGAYARKTVTGALGNCCYILFAGYYGCCSPAFSCGYRGCQSWVTGYGLTNFCAEGGLPGYTSCFWFNCCYCADSCYSAMVNGCGTFPNCCYGGPSGASFSCACYFGSDYGVPGTWSYWYTENCQANTCGYRGVIPYGSNQTTDGCAFQYIRAAGVNTTGEYESCRTGQGFTGGTYARTVGQGGFGATAFGGNCYCGAPGGPGMIRISWS